MGRDWPQPAACTCAAQAVHRTGSCKPQAYASQRTLASPFCSSSSNFTADAFAPPTHITMSLTPRLPSTHPHLFSPYLHTRWDALPDSCPTLDIWTTDSPLLIIGSHVWNTPNPVTGKMSCNGELQEQVGMTGRRDGSEAACHGQASPIRATNT